MIPFESVDTSAFRWLRGPPGKEVFNLLSGDAEVATLTWPKAYGSRAEADTAAGRWTLKRNGFLSPHVTFLDAAGKQLARLDLHLSGSRLVMARGVMYSLRRKGLLIPAWAVTAVGGGSVLHIEAVSTHGRLSGGVVSVDESARSNPDLLILLLVSWYFIVQAWFEEEAGAAAVGALVATG